MKIIIIGGVAGGATAAARLRRLDEEAEIILFEKDEYVSYANCGLPYHIGGTIGNREDLFLQTPEGFRSRFRIDVRTKSEVIAIDPAQKTVTVKDLKTATIYEEGYDKLILSTGAKPIKPAISGIENENIFSLRNVPDMDRIKSAITGKKAASVVIVGAGFIGLEMAENLKEAGLSVSVVEQADQVMGMVDYPMASMVHQYLRSQKIDLFLKENIMAFESDNGYINVYLASQKSITADIVILSIGVTPENGLAKDAGLEIGRLGGIVVNDYMQTSDTDIYAVGDAVEVKNPITGKPALIPLAGPANKQARIAADNIITGNRRVYKGTIGTSVAKVFDMTVASAGASERLLSREGIKYITSISHAGSHAGYYPGALPLSVKINFAPDGKLLGAQVVGFDGVDKRIDLLAQVIRNGGSVYDLQEIEHAYAPPFSSAKDPVNMAGFIAENILTGRVKIVHWDDMDKVGSDTVILDVRTKEEFEFGHIDKAVNIPLDELRDRLSEVPADKPIYIYCAVGLRGYTASRILLQHGYSTVYNLSGGYKTYSCVIHDQRNGTGLECDFFPVIRDDGEIRVDQEKKVIVDACGLQCPGPIRELKKHYDTLSPGQRLTIKVTDQAFGQDLNAWCNMVGAKLIDVDHSGGVITATVEKTEAKNSSASVSNHFMNNSDTKTLIVFSDDLDKALATFVIANGMLVSGKKVSIFFTFWGLSVIKKRHKPAVKKDFISRMFGMMLPSHSRKLGLSKINMMGAGGKMMRYVMKNKHIDSLEELVQQAIDGGAELIACSMSMDVMGIRKEELADGVTIGGVATYLERAEQSNINLFI